MVFQLFWSKKKYPLLYHYNSIYMRFRSKHPWPTVAENTKLGPWGYQLEGTKGTDTNILLVIPGSGYTNTKKQTYVLKNIIIHI